MNHRSKLFRKFLGRLRMALCYRKTFSVPKNRRQGGLRVVSAALPVNRPKIKSAFFALFQKAQRAPGKSRKQRKKGLFPHMSSDLLKPPSPKPPCCWDCHPKAKETASFSNALVVSTRDTNPARSCERYQLGTCMTANNTHIDIPCNPGHRQLISSHSQSLGPSWQTSPAYGE